MHVMAKDRRVVYVLQRPGPEEAVQGGCGPGVEGLRLCHHTSYGMFLAPNQVQGPQ